MLVGGFERRAAGGDDVIDDDDGIAVVKVAFDLFTLAVALGFFAYGKDLELLLIACGGHAYGE